LKFVISSITSALACPSTVSVAGKKPDIPLVERGFKAAAREVRDDQEEFEL
jgi:hypothetical protein